MGRLFRFGYVFRCESSCLGLGPHFLEPHFHYCVLGPHFHFQLPLPPPQDLGPPQVHVLLVPCLGAMAVSGIDLKCV